MSHDTSSDQSDRLNIPGRPHPRNFGRPFHFSAGHEPDSERLLQAAVRLDRDVTVVDEHGYECELIGAAIGDGGQLAYVESRAKDVGHDPDKAIGRRIEITIKIHYVDRTGQNQSVDIRSYNPYSGCDVRHFEWVGETCVLIYSEKHWTFACRFGDIWPPKFMRIEDQWIIHDGVLAYIAARGKEVQRLSFPELGELPAITIDAAKNAGLMPTEECGPGDDDGVRLIW